MIRFINLTGQIHLDNDLEFAWYDTIKSEFVEISGCQTWDSWEEFKTDLVMYMVEGRTPEKMQDEMLARFLRLFPRETQTSPAQSEQS